MCPHARCGGHPFKAKCNPAPLAVKATTYFCAGAMVDLVRLREPETPDQARWAWRKGAADGIQAALRSPAQRLALYGDRARRADGDGTTRHLFLGWARRRSSRTRLPAEASHQEAEWAVCASPRLCLERTTKRTSPPFRAAMLCFRPRNRGSSPPVPRELASPTQVGAIRRDDGGQRGRRGRGGQPRPEPGRRW